MFKGFGMAVAMLAAMGGSPIYRKTTVERQSEESKKFHLDRAAAKRARKAEKLAKQVA